MVDQADPDVLHVPVREVPVPSHVSAVAQAVLRSVGPPTTEYPALADVEGWRTLIEAGDAGLLALTTELTKGAAVQTDEFAVDGVPVYVVAPDETAPDDPRVYLDIHGGALIHGKGLACKAMGVVIASGTGLRTWAVDYRMPPDHPYPAALDDCLTVYRALLRDHEPERIVVGGTSAGANLAAALVLRARDEGLPLPAAVALLSPELDLTESGDTFATNLGIDLLGLLMPANLLYANGHDLTHPYLSPLFGDVTPGFPPTFLSSGTRDLFLSNAVRMHRALRAADIPADLHVLEAAPHGGFFNSAPEDAEITRELRLFIDRHVTTDARPH